MIFLFFVFPLVTKLMRLDHLLPTSNHYGMAPVINNVIAKELRVHDFFHSTHFIYEHQKKTCNRAKHLLSYYLYQQRLAKEQKISLTVIWFSLARNKFENAICLNSLWAKKWAKLKHLKRERVHIFVAKIWTKFFSI